MEECTAEEVQRLLPLVSAQRREQAMKYKHVFGQYCCLKSWEMLSEQVLPSTRPVQNQYTPPTEWRDFEYNPNGKPFLPGGPYFSISHCRSGIAVATDDQPIGIDIEAIRHAEEDLIRRVMNAEEQEKVHSGANEQEQARIFTRLWTQKEALVKAQGVGIASFEQLQQVLAQNDEWTIETHEEEKYIYSIAYKK